MNRQKSLETLKHIKDTFDLPDEQRDMVAYAMECIQLCIDNDLSAYGESEDQMYWDYELCDFNNAKEMYTSTDRYCTVFNSGSDLLHEYWTIDGSDEVVCITYTKEDFKNGTDDIIRADFETTYKCKLVKKVRWDIDSEWYDLL